MIGKNKIMNRRIVALFSMKSIVLLVPRKKNAIQVVMKMFANLSMDSLKNVKKDLIVMNTIDGSVTSVLAAYHSYCCGYRNNSRNCVYSHQKEK